MARSKVLLIGWDAADWKVIRPLLDAGKMPNIQRLVNEGSTGQIATLHPPLSPMLWTSIATGKRPFKHGIHGFSEPTPDGRGVQPVTNLSRTSKALWNILHQNGLRSVVIGWWPSHPAEPIRGVTVSDHYHRANGPLDEGWPLLPNAVHPRELAQALADQRVHPEQLTPQMVLPFIPLAAEINQDQDKRLAVFLRILAECMSIHSASIWLLENQPWDFFAVYHDAIDHFCHAFMKYHPPRQSWIAERDFELYHKVVSMAYQFHDQMLGTLLQKAGSDTNVVLLSDHGFHPDHLRPASIPDIPAGPAVEHRDFGIVALSGPGVRGSELLYGSTVLDIAPTILTIFGLPVGGDMDGKVLSQAFEDPPNVATIRSWEDVSGDDGSHPRHTRLDPLAAQEALQQMVALGYIEPLHGDLEVAVEKTIRELRYNLGHAYQDDGRHMEAHSIFTQLVAADPEEQRFAVALFVSCQALGMQTEMLRIVDRLEKARANPLVVDYLKAQLLIAENRYREALGLLLGLQESQPRIFLEIGGLYLRLRQWSEAQQIYEKALAADPDHAPAYLGLCRIALQRRRFGEAAHYALDSLQRVHHDPLAHFLLARALTGIQDYERAAEAFRTAISFNPNFPEAHLRLAALLEIHLRDAPSARYHRRLARRMRSGQAKPPVPEPAARFIPEETPLPMSDAEPLDGSLIVVTGLPRSGTSMMMQMLAAGGIAVMTDGSRQADEDNPRGYFELERVKNLLNDSEWLLEARGKAVKIVAPLLAALPQDLPCRVILCQRDLEKVLDSQQSMLERRNHALPRYPERRRMLKEEYQRLLIRVKSALAKRPRTRLLIVEHGTAISNPLAVAEEVNEFLGRGHDVLMMASAIDPKLHRRVLYHSPG